MEELKEKIICYMKKYYYFIIIFILVLSNLYFLFNPKVKIKKVIKTVESSIQEKNSNNIKVEIKGSVLNPGVYEMNSNDRVINLIEAAGGLLENSNTNYVNLSKKLNDEMIVIVYSNDEVNEFKDSNNTYSIIQVECECPDNINDSCITSDDILATENIEYIENDLSENNKLISINDGTVTDLVNIPGVGESKALAIIEYRNKNGKFKKIDDIKNVSGIGNSLFEKIKDYITI